MSGAISIGTIASVASAAAGVAGVVGSLAGGDSASQPIQQGGAQQMAISREMLEKQLELAKPYMDLAKSAIPGYEKLLGITVDGKLDPAMRQKFLESTPGYKFTRNEAFKQTTAGAEALGLTLSGNTLKAINNQSANLANLTYEQRLADLLAPIQVGQRAQEGAAGAITNAGREQYVTAGQTAQDLAGIDVNTGLGVANAIGGVAKDLTTQNTLKGLLNPTLSQGGNAVNPNSTLRQYAEV